MERRTISDQFQEYYEQKEKERMKEAIEGILRVVKKEIHMDTINDTIKIKKNQTLNMWYDSFSQSIVVSEGILIYLHAGRLTQDDIRVMLTHEIGHARNEPRMLEPIEWIFFLYSLGILLLLPLIYIFYSPLLNLWVGLTIFFVFIFMTLLWCYYRREWERLANKFLIEKIPNIPLIKSTFEKLHLPETRRRKMLHKKPFYYFLRSLPYNEIIKNLETMKEKMKE